MGKWIYSEGMAKYGEMPEMQGLEKIHKEMHLIAEKIIKMKQSGSVSDLEQEFATIEHLSQRLYPLLVIIPELDKTSIFGKIA